MNCRNTRPSARWLLPVCLFLTRSLPAVDWIEPNGGFFLVESNWFGGMAPFNDDVAIFDLDAQYVVTLEDGHQVSGLEVRRGAVRFEFGAFELETTVCTTIAPDFRQTATMELATGSSLRSGTVSFGEGDGILILEDGARIFADSFDVGNPDGGRSRVVLVDTPVISVETVTVWPGGSIDGGGEIAGQLTNNGLLRPSDTLDLRCFFQDVDGVVELEVRNGAGDHDRIVCQDFASLTGQLLLRFPTSFQAQSGDSFLVVDSPALAGNFSSIATEGLAPDLDTATLHEEGTLTILIGPRQPTVIDLGRTAVELTEAASFKDFVFTAPRDMVVRASIVDGNPRDENALFTRKPASSRASAPAARTTMS
jgi:hypothetical protein